MDDVMLRKRLRALREEKKWSQAELAEKMGFKDRQTLSSVESGERKIKAEELVKAASIFNVDLEFFTDPFRLYGEARFSWRKHNSLDPSEINSFEDEAGKWIATYRHLCKLKSQASKPWTQRVPITESSSLDEAAIFGERFAAQLELGPIPSLNLHKIIEDSLDTLVLTVDAMPGISGAACQLSDLNVILINRQESICRRNFDLGHELFHLLTWDALPPAHIESEAPKGRQKKIEKLADNFSAGLLMPSDILDEHFSSFSITNAVEWLNKTAAHLRVSSIALKWRLVNVNKLSQSKAAEIDDRFLRNNGGLEMRTNDKAPLFSKKFMAVIGWGLDEGHISVRKTANLLNLTIDDLSALFSSHGLNPPFDI